MQRRTAAPRRQARAQGGGLVPFRPGNGVSIYEFFHKIENWACGQMSQDHKANVLYNRHLDFSVTDGNKELEDAKENYQ